MSSHIQITHDQARALANLSEREGTLALHQLAGDANDGADDVYATPAGSTTGYRVTPDGALSPAGETLPA
jgi:hypothetical protein